MRGVDLRGAWLNGRFRAWGRAQSDADGRASLGQSAGSANTTRKNRGGRLTAEEPKLDGGAIIPRVGGSRRGMLQAGLW